MADQIFSPETLSSFREAAQSLRLYRRADLTEAESGSPLIEKLYVDPLPAEQIFQTSLRPNTTFLIGRKGTGKSTIFQRLQYELRKVKHQTTAYLDIKTIFESSQVNDALLARIQSNGVALPVEALTKLLLHREFLRQFVFAIKEELRKRIDGSWWNKVREKVTKSHAELFEGLDELLEDAGDNRFVSVLGLKLVAQKETVSYSGKDAIELGTKIKAAAMPEGEASAAIKSERSDTANSESAFADILVNSFNITELLTRLKALLQGLGIRNLFLLIDDFSELPPDAMRMVVDVLLAPLNNWSDEFIKLKVAAYPGRTYYGAIDKTKIDEVYLDVYRLYGLADVARMEESATNFTERLVVSRLDHFAGRNGGSHIFFEGDIPEIWRALFFATMGNARNLGYLLHFLYEGHLIYQRKITRRAISDAARRYYEEKIEPYFGLGKFLHESFSERSSIYSLKELLESIVSRAKDLRRHDSAVFRQIRETRHADTSRQASRVPPTSHFHITVSQEALLSTLELNFFLTKYFEMSDRDGRKVSVFALNFGLCDKYSISFGRPQGEREFRLYFVERIFDYTPLLTAYLAKNQEIQCEACTVRQPVEKLEALQLYGMLCPACGKGVCRVTNLSRKYEDTLRQVSNELLLPKMELGILQTLAQESEPLRAGAIASELDCSYQLVGKRGKILEQRGLVDRKHNDEGNRVFSITEDAKAVYFAASTSADLDV